MLIGPDENMRQYVLEIYYKGECIEQRVRLEPFLVPENGDRLHIVFQNENYTEAYGCWWVVIEKKHLFGSGAPTDALQILQLYCEPDPKKGA